MGCTLLILAAGVGSRYGGLKQIDPVMEGGHALLEYTIYDAIKAGFDKVVFIVREEIEAKVSSFFNEKLKGKIEVGYVNQRLDDVPAGCAVPSDRTKPWGTVHAVYAARKVIQEPFLVVNSDDYYGRASIEMLYNYLNKVDNNAREYAMVGYRLGTTVSRFGSVSRGLCAVDAEGYITSIEEHKRIIEEDDGNLVSIDDNGSIMQRLKASQLVSMNIFAFPHSFFQDAEQEMIHFLNSKENTANAELFIPRVVNMHIANKVATLKMIGEADKWFGITYQEDKPRVTSMLQALIAAGVYPRQLWNE